MKHQMVKDLIIVPEEPFNPTEWPNVKVYQFHMIVPGEPGFFEAEVQEIELEHPDGAWIKVEYPEFTIWRWENEDKVEPEPESPLTRRCPRCYSTQIIIGYPYIFCQHCGYDEPLIDFPMSESYYLFLEGD